MYEWKELGGGNSVEIGEPVVDYPIFNRMHEWNVKQPAKIVPNEQLSHLISISHRHCIGNTRKNVEMCIIHSGDILIV